MALLTGSAFPGKGQSPILLSAVSGEGLGQLPCSPQMARGKAGSHLSPYPHHMVDEGPGPALSLSYAQG